MEYYPQRERMKRGGKVGHVVVVAIFVAVLASAWLLFPVLRSRVNPFSSLRDGEMVGVYIGNGKISVEAAVSRQKQYQGLSGRASLPENSGMLFIFNQPERYYFTMRGMEFPLDFVWIRGNRVVDLTPNVAPPAGDKQPVVISPDQAADLVLEVNAGTIKRLKITVGAQVRVGT